MHEKIFNEFMNNWCLTDILQKPARMMDQKSQKLLTEGKMIRCYALSFTEGFYKGLCDALVIAGIIYVGLLVGLSVAGLLGHEHTIHFGKDDVDLVSNDK